MKRLMIDFDKFYFDFFVDAILQFIRSNFNIDGGPQQGILWIEHDDNTAYFTEKENRDLKSELFDDRKILFFPFSLPNFGEPIPCADGEEYAIDDYIFYQDVLDEYDTEHEFEMGIENLIGFLIEVDHDKLIINSAKYSAATALKGETIKIQENCAIFDYPMADFLLQFIRK